MLKAKPIIRFGDAAPSLPSPRHPLFPNRKRPLGLMGFVFNLPFFYRPYFLRSSRHYQWVLKIAGATEARSSLQNNSIQLPAYVLGMARRAQHAILAANGLLLGLNIYWHFQISCCYVHMGLESGIRCMNSAIFALTLAATTSLSRCFATSPENQHPVLNAK